MVVAGVAVACPPTATTSTPPTAVAASTSAATAMYGNVRVVGRSGVEGAVFCGGASRTAVVRLEPEQPRIAHPELSRQHSQWWTAEQTSQRTAVAPPFSGNRQYGQLRPLSATPTTNAVI